MQTPTPLEITLEYILKVTPPLFPWFMQSLREYQNSGAELALAHDDDVVAWLQVCLLNLRARIPLLKVITAWTCFGGSWH